jgi:uncharacterized protein YeaC (DUF1315 family)
MRRNSAVTKLWGPEAEEAKMERNTVHWRELLEYVLRNPKEKQHLLDQLKVRAITLTRWVNGEAEPRQQNLQQLVKALTRYRHNLLSNEQKDETEPDGLPFALNNTTMDSSSSIPSEVYSQILSARAHTHIHLRFWTIANMILHQAMAQLDASHQQTAVWITRYHWRDDVTPSQNRTVKSLQVVLGYQAQKPFEHIEQEGMFLGIESAEGTASVMGHPIIYQDQHQVGWLTPQTPVIEHQSAAIFPIIYQGQVAGTFTVASPHNNYFFTPDRVALTQRYSELLPLAFDTSDFIEREQIHLGVMPSYSEQKDAISTFRQRVSTLMSEILHKGASITTTEAEKLVWQALEDELMNGST